MKKARSILSFLLAVAICLTVFVGFAKNMTVTNVHADNGSDGDIIGVSLPTMQVEHISEIKNYIQSTFSGSDFTVIISDAQNAVNEQINNIHNFIFKVQRQSL